MDTEIKFRINMAKAAFNRKKTLFFSKLYLFLRKKLVQYYVWGIVFYGAEEQTLRKVDQKHLGSFKMWCWRRMGKINWTARVQNEEILHSAKKERNILHTVNRRKANWIDHVLRRSCILKHVMEGKIKEIN
jgi:hypothetical protein